ncbi:hypothetical protein JGH11_03645 [Dysgonomonas sp. Marseille-P4677]|uniref:hypothetical protein n=1 Tax=Dysgonomonas sp. Marseille-P4677 TaxID=2364790 RepID=UPI001912487B|nr:hypothetical protein [Dysgonomonas sp. Marseille-P4677]MBK5719958.1 hypothetical protein [Dysgonomonas sp. Marseille-P4677]
MKKFIYLICLIVVLFVACNSDNENDVRTMRVQSIDLSDFNLYQGIDTTAVNFNNLKKRDLIVRYFTAGGRLAFNYALYDSITFQFNADRLTYTHEKKFKILSTYTFRNDSLFINKSDGSSLFIALGSSPENLYRRKSLIRFPLTEKKDTAFALDEILNLEKSLKIAKDISNRDFVNPTDTIAWCNIIYNIE